MNLVHLSIHAYGSWLPDQPQGYVDRRRGWQPTNVPLARRYRERMLGVEVRFDPLMQRVLIDEVLTAGKYQSFDPRAIATEDSHLHAVLAWAERCTPSERLGRLKRSLTKRLNRDYGRRSWISRGGSRIVITDPEHYSYLVNEYLPSHSGWKWDHRKGWYR
jgi:hypothetical protein